MIRVLFFLTLLIAASPQIRADDGPVYTDPAMADEDFRFQGEYWGVERPTPSQRSSRQVGLQVIALGDGEFSCVKYYGGLPGAGWNGRERFIREGHRQGDIVLFPGNDYDIVLIDGVAEIRDKQFRTLGVLERIVRESPTLGVQPPDEAEVLFSSDGTSRFRNSNITPEGWLQAGTETIEPLGPFRMHAEFMLPFRPFARGQGRGNSGFYLESRYEVQVLDSFGLEGIENECGALYRTRRPDVNMCLPPLQWQTYDIVFQPATFDDAGNKTGDMHITVWHNGVLIHNDVAIPNKTGAGQPEAPFSLPTKLQDHGNPVVFRNIWILPLTPNETRNGTDWVDLDGVVAPIPIAMWGG